MRDDPSHDIPRDLVAQALNAIVQYEDAAARYVWMAFRFHETTRQFQSAVARYQITCARRVEAQHTLHDAVCVYAGRLKHDGIPCVDAEHELALVVHGATHSESLLSLECDQLTDDVVRWTRQTYEVAA
jgi:hypothetical protein